MVEAERQEPRHGSRRTLQRSLKERVQSCNCCAEELYDAIIFALSTTNGSFYGTSTPGSSETLFYDMATDDEQFADFSRHHVSYKDALKPNGPIDPEFLEKIRRQYQTDPGRWKR